ncbi:hypothetical protein FA13DRAFT_1808492 [Coprinellus micaceus]|uniref:Pre-mRNA polyadenylation factor Fip1 domain-containing protein n=1 Tax=Coprinellus micaceus TaxID=71717 RepID=A0A4Y7TWJ4_COPMI|nr:hypothetical protein FA13DRAFT_1808492 [Coprinellus micaceus]
MNNIDDDDEFLYGPSTTASAANTSAAPKPVPVEEVQQSTISHLEDQASDQQQHSPSTTPAFGKESSTTPGFGSINGDRAESLPAQDAGADEAGEEEEEVVEEEEEEEESDDDDIEIVTEAPARSLDFRQNRPSTTSRIPPGAPPIGAPTQPRAQALAAALTTEYSPLSRGAPAPSASATSISSQVAPPSTPSHQQTSVSTTTTPLPQPHLQTPQLAQQQVPTQQVTPGQLQQALTDGTEQPQQVQDEGPDPSTLPPVKAPPSHPDVDPNEAGVYNGQSILDFDLNSLADKPWRRPGNDLSDWFNYGFDEISWEAYCYRRRDLGDMAHVLKTNIINFAAMSEDQITALPSDMRGMVITSANNMMNQASAAQQAMMVDPMSGMNMGPNMGPNMNNMNAMGMGVGGMGQGMMPGMEGMMMMQGGMDGMGGGQGVQGQGQGGQGGGMGMQDGMQDGFGPQQGMMGMGDYSMQDQNQMVQPMYQGMDVAQNVQPSVQGPAGRGAALGGGGGGGGGGYRNAPRGSTGGSGSAPPQRGRGGFAGRGRGRGGYDVPPPAPVRPASPLPPNVPTGPRNQNKYKDRDNNAPAVDGLDYGGGGGGSRRTPSHEPEERSSSSRKRRSSPGMDDVRSSKRR